MNSINLKWISWVMSSLEMAFAWTFIRFRPLLIGLKPMSNFFGFTNFYRCFIAHYSSIMAPFIRLTKKDQPFSWGVEVDNAFQSLKVFFS